MVEKKDFKSTLNMPSTDFSMKANLSEKEINFRNFWTENKIYEQVLEKNKSNPKFVLHDGPPYANGSLHVGHALNKILKDIIVRYKNMSGFYSPFIPGWDTHGLPIENKVLAEMNINHKNISILELRKKAHEYALSQIEIQKNEFSKLQMLSDFKDIYKTLDKSFEEKQLELFKKLCMDKLVYRGLKPVYWSPSSQSALAEAEVEYQDHRSPSIFVKFILKDSYKEITKGTSLIIWTTTPWTLIANAGVAVNVDFDYSLIEYEGQKYLLAKDLVEKNCLDWKWENYKTIANYKGKELLCLTYISPVNGNVSPVVEGHHVSLEAGTGLVHIAPLFGEDDFIIGKKHNLKSIMHINDDGTINEESPKYCGMFYEDANKEIGMFLDEQKNLISLKFIKHSYPHDWRTKKPIIFRGTPQWFVSIDKIKSKILHELKEVKFFSEWGQKRLSLMIENRGDWTISRQRSWGVPIIIFYDENKQMVLESEVFDYVISLVKEHGSSVWYEREVDQLLPEKYRNRNWTKENDIMDVWFDSGSSFLAANVDGIASPFDLYLEGSDQYRGWFNSSLINSVAFQGKAPYKQLVSHGFVLDEKGRKMSKSLGNGVELMEIIQKYGAEILRLWVANSEYSNDISIGNNIMNQAVDLYKKLRNSIRFLLSNLYDYDYVQIERTGVHLLIKERLENLKIQTKNFYESYAFINMIKNINNFIIDTSAFYFSVTKDALYTNEQNDDERRMIQTNMYEILDFLLKALNPILPTTCEEAYGYFNKKDKKISINLEEFDKLSTDVESFEQENLWKEFFALKDQVYKNIEEKIKEGLIKRSNEAKVTIKTSSEFLKSLDLKNLLMVGQVEFGQENKIELFESLKCLRCWNHFETKEIKDDLCAKCYSIIN